MFGVVSIAIGVLIYLVVTMIIPMIGASVEDATPTIDNTSMWSTTSNPDLPSAANTWATVSGLLNLVVIITILAGILQILMALGIPQQLMGRR